jgi:tetratricopeptide (TPR) repeat protein
MDRAEAAGDDDRAVSIGIDWASAFPDQVLPAMRLCDAQCRTGDVGAALWTIEAALAHKPKDTILLKRASKLARMLEDYERAIEYSLAAAATDPNETRQAMLDVADMRVSLADHAGAREALEAAFAAGEPRENHRATEALIAYLRRDRALGLALLEAEDAAGRASATIESIRKKLMLLPTVRDEKPAIRLQSAATAELRAYADATNVPTAALDADKTRLITAAGDILIERAPDSRSLVLAFGGLSTMFGGVAEDMGFLVNRTRINAMFVSDPQRLFMLGGFASVGDYAATIAWLKALREAWSLENFYCLGLSGGGYPALRYGLDLGARRVLTFAAPTQITPGITAIDKRATALAHRVLTRKPDMCVNLRDEIAKHGDAAPEIINYYGTEMAEDAYHARNIEGLPTVISRGVAGLDSHAVIRWLKDSGSFRDILSEFLRDAS